jgi:hypothetical protein
MPNRGQGKRAIARRVVARGRLDQSVVVHRDCGPHPNERHPTPWEERNARELGMRKIKIKLKLLHNSV